MNPILSDFLQDISKVESMVSLVESLSRAPLLAEDSVILVNNTISNDVHNIINSAHSSRTSMPIFNGVLLLYVSGRFEFFVRELFEDMCDSLAVRFVKFSALPKVMREKLIFMTSTVISDPRKFGHGDGAMRSFVNMLSKNLDDEPTQAVNSKCLSVTFENMTSKTLNELFGRASLKSIWESLGQQNSVKAHFETLDTAYATKLSKDALDEIMHLRNQIAHPSGNLTWPSSSDLIRHIRYLRVIATEINLVSSLHASTVSGAM